MISALRKGAAPDVGLAALSLRAKERDAISSASLFRRILYAVTRSSLRRDCVDEIQSIRRTNASDVVPAGSSRE